MKPYSLALIFLAGILMVGCDAEDEGNPHRAEQRFTATEYERPYHSAFNNCNVKVIRDNQTGCEYLQVCISIAPMPHTCKQDRGEQ